MCSTNSVPNSTHGIGEGFQDLPLYQVFDEKPETAETKVVAFLANTNLQNIVEF